ncbi:hypothetical protein WJU23_20035 [Prosthecobacter sp. SYSU 5D2]|uniref:hypothetical protein n=1 Tax=Prosthecobacter sp. SYSU 5D2 TaxID=3134134 RepID=UPI0031FE65F8
MANSSSPSSADPETGSVLPYTDVKPVGAADFYTAVNATFRFIQRRLGHDGLLRYWAELGRSYYAPVTRRWQAGGLPAVAAHWRAFFAAEPGADVEVTESESEVTVQVHTCPAIKFLRDHNREIHPTFCHHCYHVSTAIGEGAEVEVRVSGGNGTCTQRFAKAGHFPTPQSPEDIQTATC